MHHDDEQPGYDLGHPMPMKILVGVFGALLFFTFLTVWVANQHLGSIDLSISMLIATVKATLVAVFFMHLVHDKGINRLAFISAIIFAGLFMAVVLGDGVEYQHNIQEFHSATTSIVD